MILTRYSMAALDPNANSVSSLNVYMKILSAYTKLKSSKGSNDKN